MRKPRSGLVVVVGIIAALGMGSVSLGATTLPAYENFESGSLNADWSVNGSAGSSAEVQSTDVIEGSQSAATSFADLTLAIDGTEDATNVWTQIYTKPTLYEWSTVVDDPTLDAGTVASFFVTTTGQVRANDGATFTEIGSVTTGEALAFSVHTDFVNDKWDLFVSDDGTLGTVMKRLNASPLSLNPNAAATTKLTEFTIGGVAVLDAVALAKDLNSVPDLHSTPNASNVLVIAKDLTAGRSEAVSIQAHGYSVLADTAIGGALGDELLLALDVDDDVYLRWENSTPYFRRTAIPDWDDTGAPGVDPLLAYINPGLGLWVKKNSSGPFVLFSDYDVLTSFTRPVYGTDVGGGGLNRLAWDRPEKSEPANVGHFGFNGVAVDGDWLYLGRDGGKLLHRSGGVWRDGANPATQRLSPGENFWFISRLVGPDRSWNLPLAQ